MQHSKSSPPDDLPNCMFKWYAPFLAVPVASILNESVQKSCVPTKWKQADIIPIRKTTTVEDMPKDLRPVSLTATLSKVCERFVINWLSLGGHLGRD